MDKSNPELYEKLQSYKVQSAQGLNSFDYAQGISVPPLVARAAIVGSRGDRCPSPSVLNEGIDDLPEPDSQPLSGTATPSGFGSSSTYSTHGLSYFLLRIPFLVSSYLTIASTLTHQSVSIFILEINSPRNISSYEYQPADFLNSNNFTADIVLKHLMVKAASKIMLKPRLANHKLFCCSAVRLNICWIYPHSYLVAY